MTPIGALGENAARRTYEGVWRVLRRWMRVPDQPPTLPASSGTTIEGFRPGEGWLRYLTFQLCIVLLVIDGAILLGWIMVTVMNPFLGAVLAIPALVIAIVPDLIAYAAIHLRYDTTWYVLSDRSMRIRRGIWIIHETTITYENVQNVMVKQGPIQRWFGIADVVVQSAGGGGAAHAPSMSAGHVGVLEGVVDADRIRTMILDRAAQFRTAGLGDEGHDVAAVDETIRSRRASPSWTPEHLAALREVREAVRALSTTP